MDGNPGGVQVFFDVSCVLVWCGLFDVSESVAPEKREAGPDLEYSSIRGDACLHAYAEIQCSAWCGTV
jgi:hypothetical protein